MTAVEVLDELRQRGVVLEPKGDVLRYRAPKGALTVELREALVENKTELIQLLSHPSTFKPDALSDHLLSRLLAGNQWLVNQHQLWLSEDPAAASDERFSAALAAWDEMERSLRLVYDYAGCIFGLDQRCPQDAPVTCDGCRG